jgi:hypothetical protein
METEEHFNKLRNQILIFVLVATALCIGLSGFILYQLIDIKGPLSLILCLSVIVFFLIAASVTITWLGNIRFKQLIECQCLQIENDKKRDYDKTQAQMNQTYRLAALKWERLHQVVTEISEKTTTKSVEEDGKKKEVINTILNNKLIDSINQTTQNRNR